MKNFKKFQLSKNDKAALCHKVVDKYIIYMIELY